MSVIQSSKLASGHSGSISARGADIVGAAETPPALQQKNRPVQEMWDANTEFALFLREMGEQLERDAAYIAVMQHNFDNSDQSAAGSFK